MSESALSQTLLHCCEAIGLDYAACLGHAAYLGFAACGSV